MRTSRDQGALDPPILSQSRKAQNCYLAMAAMRRWFLTRAAPLCWRAARLPPIFDRCAASHRTSRSVFWNRMSICLLHAERQHLVRV